MVFKIELTETAKQDIEKAVDYYNSKSGGLGKKFYQQFKEAVQKIQLHPLYYSYYEKPFRRLLLKDFPYLVIYRIYDETIVITGVLFGKVDPDKIIHRTR